MAGFINFLKLLVGSSAGYVISDLARWINTTFFPAANLSDGKGGFKWWYVLLIFVALTAIIAGVFYLLNMLLPKSKRK